MARNEALLKKAEALFPALHETKVAPVRTITPVEKEGRFFAEDAADFHTRELSTGDRVVLDFGDHETGYLTAAFGFTGSYPDAPAWIRVRFAERLNEFFESAVDYKGWVSAAWIQETERHLDVLPQTVTFQRRCAFRYVMIEAVDISTRYRLTVDDIYATAVSSADDASLLPYEGEDERCRKIDQIAVRTLHECMQKVFEDGPKRDRRLWMGDLRLEALSNYQTYQKNDLVKCCLYLFGGDTLQNGQVGASLFTAGTIAVDDAPMFDYSLFYVNTLLDYVKETGDKEALSDLYPVAKRQVEIAAERLDERGVIADSDELGWCFVDWNLSLNKQASAQGIYLYALLAARELAELFGEEADAARFSELYAAGAAAAKAALFDETKGVFVSGTDRQISMASQCWMVIGGVLSGDEAAALLQRAEELPEAEGMVTPYMYHHYIEALRLSGLTGKAKEVLLSYWGGMADEGADTFFELYHPGHPNKSPYGGTIVLSYCHAWSCAPAYFLRKYGW